MRKETLFKKAMNTASDIHWNEERLNKIAFVIDGGYTKLGKTDKHEFEKELKLNKTLYKKLRNYRDEIFNQRVTNKTITKEEYRLINDKINALLEGTYKEKYC